MTIDEMSDTTKRGPVGRGGLNNANLQISNKLRAYYDSVREQEIPDRFLDLLEKLDEAEQAAQAKDIGESEAQKNERS